MNTDIIEKKIGIVFKDKALLEKAFTHRSYLNENRGLGLEHNERLEFLGDAVLELVVTDFLYRKYPKKPEGEMTSLRSALVNSTMLAEISSSLNFSEYLLLSRGEAKDKGRARQYILANTFESVVGAIYLDQGYAGSEKFISDFLLPKIDEVEEKRLWIDAKSFFQEQAQEKFGSTPQYKTLKDHGPDHDKVFTVGVFIGEDLIAEGSGKSKQDAEQEAARNALDKKGW